MYDMGRTLSQPCIMRISKFLLLQYFAAVFAQLDKETLLAIKSEFVKSQGGALRNLSTWNDTNNNPCTWTGLLCDQSTRSRIVSFNLSGFDLQGPLPITYFRELLPQLETLDISRNNLTGDISSLVSSGCPHLRILNLSHNNFSGVIPSGAEKCESLEALDLSFNQIRGHIPSSLMNMCGSIKDVNLMSNLLNGTLPVVEVNCSSIEILNFGGNYIGGSFPRSYSRLKNLRRITVVYNNITGFVPEWFPELPRLELLALSANRFSGPIPVSLVENLRLENLFLNDNKLRGEIPLELSKLHNLKTLDLSHNQLTGQIPSELCSLKYLQALLLGQNNLNGSIPRDIGNLTHLQLLDLSFNHLSGEIPVSIGKLQRLLWLSLTSNSIVGSIPEDITNCSSLKWLQAASNQLSGKIPEKIWLMGSRANDTFALNERQGISLPRESAASCNTFLRWLPVEILGMTENIRIDRCIIFWDMALRGRFSISSCTKIGTNGPGYIQLSDNQLSGPIPDLVVNSVNMSFVYLGLNNLQGSIPEALSNLPLTTLNLSSNRLSGQIPTELGDAICLVDLDLSFNNLSRMIPPSLHKLTLLSKFNISYNPHLRGPIPTGAQFSTFKPDSYFGNNGLCLDYPHGEVAKNTSKGNYSQELCSVRYKKVSTYTPSRGGKYTEPSLILLAVMAVALDLVL